MKITIIILTNFEKLIGKFRAFFPKRQKNEKLLQKLLIFFVQYVMMTVTVRTSFGVLRCISEQSSA